VLKPQPSGMHFVSLMLVLSDRSILVKFNELSVIVLSVFKVPYDYLRVSRHLKEFVESALTELWSDSTYFLQGSDLQQNE
jgi:hypothetical protein